MLTIVIPAVEQYDEDKNEFVISRARSLQLEHSLVSISKWESRWRKPFLSKNDKTVAETIDYIRCMTITQTNDDKSYEFATNENVQQVRDYINEEMTATTFSNEKKLVNREVVTSEIIYYWMIALNIPFECQKWHLNRLLTLINVCNIKNTPQKKMNKRDLARRNSSLNAARKQAMQSEG